MDNVVDDTVDGSSKKPPGAEESTSTAARCFHSKRRSMLTSLSSREGASTAFVKSQWAFETSESLPSLLPSHGEATMKVSSTEGMPTTTVTTTTTSGGCTKNNNSWVYTQFSDPSSSCGLPLQICNAERGALDTSSRLATAAQGSGDVLRDSVGKGYRTTKTTFSEAEVLVSDAPHRTPTTSKKCGVETDSEGSNFTTEVKGSSCCMLLAYQQDALPITPEEALTRCRGHLSTHEQKEILEFPEIYYCGSHAHRSLTSKTFGDYSGNYNQQQQQWDRQCSAEYFHDEEHNYRVTCGDHIAYRYELLDILGHGTYGVVVRALDHAARPMPQQCALKIAKNIPSYAAAVALEADILEYLRHARQRVEVWIPQVLSRFTFRSHKIVVFPLYGLDLKKLLRLNLFRPLPSKLVRAFTAQMIATLQGLSAVNVTHADVKPDNIVLINRSSYDRAIPCSIEQQLREEKEQRRGRVAISNGIPRCDSHCVTSVYENSPSIDHTQGLKNDFESNLGNNDDFFYPDKVGGEIRGKNEADDVAVTSHVLMIDFGNARVGTSCAHPVQSLNYRAPEAALRLSYGQPIDMWSLGCVVYELSTGLPLFQAESDTELLQSHLAVLGPPSIDFQLAQENLFVGLGNEEDIARRQAFFASLQTGIGGKYPTSESTNLLQLLQIRVNGDKSSYHHHHHCCYQQQEKSKAETKKRGEDDGVHSAISAVNYAKTTMDSQGHEKTNSPLIMLDFLLGCLSWDPSERLTPDEACCHPYLATFFRGGGIGVGRYGKVPSMTRFSGLYFLRNHTLTRSAADILETSERELLHQIPGATSSDGTQISMKLDVRRAIRPLRCFTTGDEMGGVNASLETPLRVSVASQSPKESVEGGKGDDVPRSYTAAFFDPFERVHVSIMSFEDH